MEGDCGYSQELAEQQAADLEALGQVQEYDDDHQSFAQSFDEMTP